jgi:hypothetical protein
MAELQPRLQLPTYFTQPKEDNSQYTHSFMQAQQDARRENSPMAKAQLAQAQQQIALFPLKRQALEMDLQGKAADMTTNQEIMADRTRTKASAAKIAGILGKVQDWANADAELGEAAKVLSEGWTPELQKMFDGIEARAQNAKTVRENNQARIDIAAMREDARVLSKGDETVPKLIELGGKTFIYNPKTGSNEPLNKEMTKQQFVERLLPGLMREAEVDEVKAADRLSKLYDEKISKMSNTQSKPTVNVGRFKVTPR